MLVVRAFLIWVIAVEVESNMHKIAVQTFIFLPHDMYRCIEYVANFTALVKSTRFLEHIHSWVCMATSSPVVIFVN